MADLGSTRAATAKAFSLEPYSYAEARAIAEALEIAEPVAVPDAPVERAAPQVPEPEEAGAGIAGRPETDAERTERSPRRQGRRKQSRRRRKHGRNR